MPSPPGLVSVMLRARRGRRRSACSCAPSRRARRRRRGSASNGIRPASRITGTISVREPSFFSTSTARPRLTWPSCTRWGLPSISSKWSAITGMSSRGARDRVGDQVREGDLALGRLQLRAARVERRHGERAEARRGRDRARLLHVARERRRAALHQLRLACAVPRAPCGARAVARGAVAGGRREHVGLDDPPGRAAARDLRRDPRPRPPPRARPPARPSEPRARAARRLARSWPRSRSGAVAARVAPASPARRGAVARSPTAMRAITCPTVTVSPSCDEQLGRPCRSPGRAARRRPCRWRSRRSCVALDRSRRPSTCHSRIVPSRDRLAGGRRHDVDELLRSPPRRLAPAPVAVALRAVARPPGRRERGRSARLVSAVAPSRPRRCSSWRSPCAAAARLRAPVADGDARDHLPDRDRVALLDEQLGDACRRGRGQLDVDLVGRDLDDRRVGLDRVADLDMPFEDCSLGDRLARGRGHDVDYLLSRGACGH